MVSNAESTHRGSHRNLEESCMAVAAVFRSTLAGTAILAATVAALIPGVATAGRTRGFVVATILYPVNGKPEVDCPKGYALPAAEVYLLTVSPEERERLRKPENTRELNALGTSRGIKGFSTRQNPEAVKDPPFPEPQGGIAYGMNLDGAVGGGAPNTCPHQEFTSPSGERGIDNQSYRIVACIDGFRNHFADDYRNTENRRSQRPLLIQLSNIDNERNDPDVTVTIANGTDPMVANASGMPLPNASYVMGSNASLGVTTKRGGSSTEC
jgi:hypothetical protein